MKILPKMKKIQCRCNAFITRQLRRVSIFSKAEYLLSGLASWNCCIFNIFQFFQIFSRNHMQSGEIRIDVCSEYSVESTGHHAGI